MERKIRVWKCLTCKATLFMYLNRDGSEVGDFVGKECICSPERYRWDENGPWDIDETVLVVWNEEEAK